MRSAAARSVVQQFALDGRQRFPSVLSFIEFHQDPFGPRDFLGSHIENTIDDFELARMESALAVKTKSTGIDRLVFEEVAIANIETGSIDGINRRGTGGSHDHLERQKQFHAILARLTSNIADVISSPKISDAIRSDAAAISGECSNPAADSIIACSRTFPLCKPLLTSSSRIADSAYFMSAAFSTFGRQMPSG